MARSSRPLDAIELAEVAVLTDLALALVVSGFFLPAGTLLILAGMVPFALLAARRRFRALVVGGFVGVTLSAVTLGPNGPLNMALVVGCGGAAGLGLRHGWGRVRTVAFGAVLVWVPAAALTIGSLTAFDTSRHLVFAQMRAVADGVVRIIRQPWPRQAVDAFLAHWQLAIAAGELAMVCGLVLLSLALTRPLLRRLAGVLRDPLLPPPDQESPETAPGPVPVQLTDAGYRYPGASIAALRGVSLRVGPGELVAVTGPNGSGKSTLGLLLAGMPPTSGAVVRPGGAGLGRPGGTAVIGQRPESQVLGVLARDDVVWGLADPSGVDVDLLLHRVGLAGMGGRETTTLSGGQLQRLAVAAALARRPSLLVSDESTSMLDPEGRAAVVGILRRLATEGLAVVHVTHRPADLAVADRVVRVVDGRAVDWVP